MYNQKAELVEKLEMAYKIAKRHEELNMVENHEDGCGTLLIGIGAIVAYWYHFNPPFLLGLMVSIPLLFSGYLLLGLLQGIVEYGNKDEKQKEIQYLENEFEKLFDISLEYMSSTKLNYMIKALKSGEADTFKEALAVAKKDEQYDSVKSAMKRQSELLEDQIDATYHAEEAAERAYYEAKKLRK